MHLRRDYEFKSVDDFTRLREALADAISPTEDVVLASSSGLRIEMALGQTCIIVGPIADVRAAYISTIDK